MKFYILAIMASAANAATPAFAAVTAGAVQKSSKLQFVFAKPVQLTKFHCSAFEEMTLLRVETPLGLSFDY